MYHAYRKNSISLRTAIFQSYQEKCAYCGRVIQQRDLHIDHILPVHIEKCDDEMSAYLEELSREGAVSFENCTFENTSVEHYLTSDRADPLELADMPPL